MNLLCDVGPSFAAFSELNPLDDELLGNVQFAFAKRKGLKADVRTGKIRISTSGSEVLPSDLRNIPLTCDFPD